MDLYNILEEVKCVAREVGAYQKSMMGRIPKVLTKSNEIDFVTEVDKKSEEMILSKIVPLIKDSSVLAEESGLKTTDSDYTWVVDPLDGTTNYVNSFPIYCVSIGLKFKDEPILGVVYAPELDYMFSAIKGEGAFFNDEKIRVSEKEELRASFLASGLPYSKLKDDRFKKYFNSVITKISGFRRGGSAALDICLIAKGVFDIYFEVSISEWDYCAASVIVSEAGGELIKYKNYEKGKDFIISGNKKITTELIDVFESL